MAEIIARTQTELDVAIAAAVEKETTIILEGDGAFLIATTLNILFEARGMSSPRLMALGSSTVHLVVMGDSTPRLVARDHSTVHLVVRGHSTVHLVVRGHSTVHIEARDYSTVHLVARDYNTVHIEARDYAHLVMTGKQAHASLDNQATALLMQGAQARGGTSRRVDVLTAGDWIECYGVQPSPSSGTVILYKAVSVDYTSVYGFLYTPGTIPQAPDWDGGKEECGGGLHFCATPLACLDFMSDGTRFMACPVRISDIVVHRDAWYPSKVKAPGACAPIWEVDRYGVAV